MTVYIAGALALHLAPLIAIDPPEEPTFDDEETVCGHPAPCCDELAPQELEADVEIFEGRMRFDAGPTEPLTREMAIEQARIGIRFGWDKPPSTPPKIRPVLAFDDEIYMELVENECCSSLDYRFRVAQTPLIPGARRMSAPATIEVGRPTVVGGLDRDTAKRYLKRQARALVSCGEVGTTTKLTFELAIEPDGRVRSYLGGSECVEREAKAFRFPATGELSRLAVSIAIERGELRYGTTSTDAAVLVR